MGAKIQKRWSSDEIETLRGLIDAGYDYHQIAESLHRSYNSVQNKSKRIGLCCSNKTELSEATQKRVHWRPTEDKYDLVDGHELRLRLGGACGTASEAARKMGVLPGTLNNWISANYIPKYVTLLLEKLFDIPYDAIKPKEPEVEIEMAIPAEEAKENTVELTCAIVDDLSDRVLSQLEETIYRAVKRAFEEI